MLLFLLLIYLWWYVCYGSYACVVRGDTVGNLRNRNRNRSYGACMCAHARANNNLLNTTQSQRTTQSTLTNSQNKRRMAHPQFDMLLWVSLLATAHTVPVPDESSDTHEPVAVNPADACESRSTILILSFENMLASNPGLLCIFVAFTYAGKKVSEGAVHPLLYPSTFLSCIMLAVFVGSILDVDCSMHLAVFGLGVLLALAVMRVRVLPYLSIGAVAGMSLVGFIMQAILRQEPFSYSSSMNMGIGALSGSAVMYYAGVPVSVASRTKGQTPSFETQITLPFHIDDIFAAFLDPDRQLGLPRWAKVTYEPKRVTEYKGKQILTPGVRRRLELPTGTTDSELLHTAAPHRIVWKQIDSDLKGMSMHGSGKGDEPGILIDLEPVFHGTRVFFKYFYSELRNDQNINWFGPPLTMEDGIKVDTLQSQLRDDLINRGLVERSQTSESTIDNTNATAPAVAEAESPTVMKASVSVSTWHSSILPTAISHAASTIHLNTPAGTKHWQSGWRWLPRPTLPVPSLKKSPMSSDKVNVGRLASDASGETKASAFGVSPASKTSLY